MVFMLLGIVIGGLSVGMYMRELTMRIEAEIAAATAQGQVKAASAPPVKTRTIGEGSKATKKKKPEPKPEPESEPDSEPESTDDEAEPAAAAAADGDVDGEEGKADEEADEEAPKKPSFNLKLPEPSSASEASDEEE